MERAMVLFSGGPDSTAAALWGLDNGFEVELVSFLFNIGKTDGELRQAMNVAEELGAPHTIIDLQALLRFFGDGIRPLMHGGTREPEHNDDEQKKRRLLPYGAGVALSVASSVAMHKGIKDLIWGATKDDGATRPDYRQKFASQLSQTINVVDEGKDFEIHAPLTDMHKYQILEHYYPTRPELFALTWSCTDSAQKQCGVCHACLARRIAAQVSKIDDNTSYTQKDFAMPLTDEQISNPEMVDEDVWFNLLASPKAPQF